MTPTRYTCKDIEAMKEVPPKSKTAREDIADADGIAAKSASNSQVPEATGSTPPAPAEMSPEEQMALYEKDLKENDWGHQPC